ncbi:MAG: nitrophenyl compound nitroreductase subunit ArsF family protein [Candidatus Omnitrophota bacterium]
MRKAFSLLLALMLIGVCAGYSFAADKPSDNKVIAYYFHGNFRCANCKTIEQYTKEAVEKYFRKELDAGKVVFKAINVETKGNEHFTDDYQLYTKSVVLSLVKDGKEVKFDNLNKVWEHLRNKEAFHQYIKTEVEKYLKEL